MVGLIDGFRWAPLAGNTQLYWPGVWFSIVLVSLLLVTGVIHFRKTRTFADLI